MRVEIVKWGGNLGLPLSGPIAEKAGVVEGSVVDLRVENGNLIMRVEPSNAIFLEDILEGITEENIHKVIDTGNDIGRENS